MVKHRHALVWPLIVDLLAKTIELFPCRALYNRIMENPEDNLLTTMSGGVEELLRPETKNFGILAEGVVADHMKGLHCDLYSVGHLNDRGTTQ